MSARTIGDRFDRTAARLGARIAVREPERDWSWADLLRSADGVSRALAALGGGPGMRVGLMLPNSAAFVAAFLPVALVADLVAALAGAFVTWSRPRAMPDMLARWRNR